ncbi:hypothetical protein V6N12_043977 [Hibiscus sabdariffa]|uniref:CS domain-containing protein n=1 Tax=Hibiscus sabdariffa TaxID=183260 RepID=A0ABR2DIU3_9ROSI
MRTPEADDPLPPIKNNGLDMENYSLSQTLGDTTVQGQPLLIDGELFAAVKVSESCWTLEDHETVSILLPKCKQWEWWKSLVKGDPAIDTRRCLPGVRRLDGLGYEAERHMRKLLFDYGQKCKGLPTSEDCPEVLQKFILFEPLPSSILRVNLVICIGLILVGMTVTCRILTCVICSNAWILGDLINVYAVCTAHLIVIIIELEVIVDEYDIIGKPVAAPRSSRLTQAPPDQLGTVMA